MLHNEIASIIENTAMYDIAAKTVRGYQLSDLERETVASLDEWARNIGKTGCDADHEIAAFIAKVINEEVYNTPDELLGYMFDEGNVGEFDDIEFSVNPANTLVPHLAAHGGNVGKSYLDITFVKPTWRNRQVESQIQYADLRRNGWKSIALITDYAVAALKNQLFKDVFEVVDAAIADGENLINETSGAPTQVSMDQMALYLNDRASDGVIVALSKYIQAASKLNGFTSDEMINEVHRTGRLGVYDGCSMVPISAAKKLGDKTLMIPDKRMYGIAGKVGALNMRGEVHVYETMDNNAEKCDLKFADFTYGYAFYKNNLENICKMVIQGA